MSVLVEVLCLRAGPHHSLGPEHQERNCSRKPFVISWGDGGVRQSRGYLHVQVPRHCPDLGHLV